MAGLGSRHGSLEGDPRFQCSICLGVLRDAHLTECCGQHYCSACLVQWDTNSVQPRRTCPQCRRENFTHIKNKSLMREIRGTPTYHDASLKYSCVLCKVEPLSEPCLTECCGQHFCKPCLTDSLQARPRKTCPNCGQENFKHILNKSLKREIEEKFVRCIHLKEGCLWRGHRKHLREHLGPSSSANSCDYAEHSCLFKFCRKTTKRADFERHLKVCKYRRDRCTHCGLEVSHDAMNLHHDECPEVPVPCPNHCNDFKTMKRKDLELHTKTCPLEVIDCPYAEAGCDERAERRDMERHILANTEKHMILLQEHNGKLQRKIQELHVQNMALDERNKDLQKWNRELTTRLLCLQ